MNKLQERRNAVRDYNKRSTINLLQKLLKLSADDEVEYGGEGAYLRFTSRDLKEGNVAHSITIMLNYDGEYQLLVEQPRLDTFVSDEKYINQVSNFYRLVVAIVNNFTNITQDLLEDFENVKKVGE